MSMKFFTGLQDFLGLYDPPIPPSTSSSTAQIAGIFASAASSHQTQSKKRSAAAINNEELGDEQISRCSHNRSVHFPDDDDLVSGYHDAPHNAFNSPQVYDNKSIAEAYANACKRLKISPNSTVERQIAYFHHIAGVRQECLSLKGQRLSMSHMECLEEIFKRVQFDTLDFEYTFIDDDAAVSLAEMLEFYDSTLKLNLSFNKQINFRGWQALFRAIKNCQSLQLLNLRYTSLSDRAVPILARTLRTQPTLTSLHLENVSLSGKNLLLLVCALKMNTVLKELYLGENNLQPADGAHLYQLIIGNSSIQMIDLRNNQLQDCGLRHICDALRNKEAAQKSALSALVLWNNRLTGASIESLANALKENNKLETLNIGSNNLSLEGIVALKPALLANSSLQRLGLQATNLDCQCAIVLAECLADNNVMVRVDLRDNAQIGSAGLLALHLAMKMNTSITLLNLDNSCANSGSAKVKEYQEQFKLYFDEIKQFCERNKQLALKRLSVQSSVMEDHNESSSESSESSDREEEEEVSAKAHNEASDGEVGEKKVRDKTAALKPRLKSTDSASNKRNLWKFSRTSSLTCTELVEDINERIVQMSRSLSSLDEAVDSEAVVKKSSPSNSAPPAKVELGKSPSLPVLPTADLGKDSTATIKSKPRRFSVSLSTLSTSNPDLYRSPRFKVERVSLPSCSTSLPPPSNNKKNNEASPAPSNSKLKIAPGKSTESIKTAQQASAAVHNAVDGNLKSTNACVGDDFVFVADKNCVVNGPSRCTAHCAPELLHLDVDKEASVFQDAQQEFKEPQRKILRAENIDSKEELVEDIGFAKHADLLASGDLALRLEICPGNFSSQMASNSKVKSGWPHIIGDSDSTSSEIISESVPRTSQMNVAEINAKKGAGESLSTCQVPLSVEQSDSMRSFANSREKRPETVKEACNVREIGSGTRVKRPADSNIHRKISSVTTNTATDLAKRSEGYCACEATAEATKNAGTSERFPHPCMLDLTKATSDEEAIRKVVKDLVNFTSYTMGDEGYRNSPLAKLPSPGNWDSPMNIRTITFPSFKSSEDGKNRNSEPEDDDLVVRSIVRGLVRDVLLKEKETLRKSLQRKREKMNLTSPDFP